MNDPLPGRYPAIVKSYDQVTRTCRVEIPGISSGGDSLLLAEIEYPIGDKSRLGVWQTELEILPEDTVWVAFINNDSRYPIITGYRNPQINNSVDWRRWHHMNMESVADNELRLVVGNSTAVMVPTKITLTADTEIKLVVGNSSIVITSTAITMTSTDTNITSKVNITGSEVKHGGVNISKTHIHADPQGDNTGVPS